MSLRAASTLVALALLLVAPHGAAQGHEHGAAGSGVLLIADTPEDGRTVVGDITHFSYVILDDDGQPQPHNDVHVRVILNGHELYSTESAHDYDGVGGLDVVFPVTGRYNVTVTVPGPPDRTAHFEGYVVPAEAPIAVELVASLPARADAGSLTRFEYHVADATGAIVPHTDALVEIRRVADDFPVFAVHTHTHDAPMAFQYAFETSGTYLVTIVGYTAFPSEDAPVFAPVVKTHLVEVSGQAGPSGVPSAPVDPGMTADAVARDARYRTEMSADPASGTAMRVGPFSQVRTSTSTYDEAAGRLIQHIDYTATLSGPYGPLFRSDNLHEYDGVLEIMSANQMTGAYTWDVTAHLGGNETTQRLTYDVLPANAPAFSAGPQFLRTTGLDRLVAGRSGEIGFFVHGAGDVPFQHGEIQVRLTDTGGVPLLIHKLHTHGSGRFDMRYTMPTPGDYTLQVDPFDVHGAPTPTYHGRTLGAPRDLGFTVTTGQSLQDVPLGPAMDETVGEETPGPLLPLLLVALLAAIGARARLRPHMR